MTGEQTYEKKFLFIYPLLYGIYSGRLREQRYCSAGCRTTRADGRSQWRRNKRSRWRTNGSTGRLIAVQFEENTVVYQLNDGTAADSLFAQLPFTVEIEDYSTNEKIFYPPCELDTSDSPLATEGAGTLAYYEPWGDVVFFYGGYNENPYLYQTVSR